MTITPDIHNDFVIYQGATFNEPLDFLDEEDNIPDFTGITARMAVRKSYSSEEALVELTTENGGIVNGGTDGTLTLQIPASETANMPSGVYVFDLELVSGAIVDRYIQGALNVSREVTR